MGVGSGSLHRKTSSARTSKPCLGEMLPPHPMSSPLTTPTAQNAPLQPHPLLQGNAGGIDSVTQTLLGQEFNSQQQLQGQKAFGPPSNKDQNGERLDGRNGKQKSRNAQSTQQNQSISCSSSEDQKTKLKRGLNALEKDSSSANTPLKKIKLLYTAVKGSGEGRLREATCEGILSEDEDDY